MIREATEKDYAYLEWLLINRSFTCGPEGMRKFSTFVCDGIEDIAGFFTVDLSRKLLVHFCTSHKLKKRLSVKYARQMLSFLKKLLPGNFFVAVPISDRRLNKIVTTYWRTIKLVSKQPGVGGIMHNIYLVEV